MLLTQSMKPTDIDFYSSESVVYSSKHEESCSGSDVCSSPGDIPRSDRDTPSLEGDVNYSVGDSAGYSRSPGALIPQISLHILKTNNSTDRGIEGGKER